MAVDIDKMTNVLVVYNTEDAEEVEVRLRMEKLSAHERRWIRKTWEFLLAMNNSVRKSMSIRKKRQRHVL